LFFRVVDGSNSVVKHDKKDKRHVKKSRKGGFFIIGQFLFSVISKCLGSAELIWIAVKLYKKGLHISKGICNRAVIELQWSHDGAQTEP